MFLGISGMVWGWGFVVALLVAGFFFIAPFFRKKLRRWSNMKMIIQIEECFTKQLDEFEECFTKRIDEIEEMVRRYESQANGHE